MHIQTTKRVKVLKYSLKLERYVSIELASLLFLKDIDNSRSFGNKSTALSISQKLNLLLDSGTVSKTERQTFEYFMNIRNKFMHDINANSYSNAFEQIQGLIKHLKEKYPSNFTDNSNDEVAFEHCVDSLYKDCINILLTQKGTKLKNVQRESKIVANLALYEALKESIDENLKKFRLKIMRDDSYKAIRAQLAFDLALLASDIDQESVSRAVDKVSNAKFPID